LQIEFISFINENFVSRFINRAVTFNFFDCNYQISCRILQGSHGVRDLHLLEAAAARPQATFEGKDLYSDIFSKAAALLDSIIRNHPFLDGNKRTAIGAACLFLERNG